MKFALIVSAALFALPLSAQADMRSEVRTNCQPDVKANCGMDLSRDKALACLIENAGKLSGDCKSALQKASCEARAPGNLKAAFACPG